MRRLIAVVGLVCWPPWLVAAAAPGAADRRRAGAAPDDRPRQIENRDDRHLPAAKSWCWRWPATLDRAAQAATDPEVAPSALVARRSSCIDWFLKENPDPPRERQVRFQAAVYRWAQAQSWSADLAADARRSQAARAGRRGARRRDRPLSVGRRRRQRPRPWPTTCGSAWRRRWPTGPTSSRPVRPAAGPGNPKPWACSINPRRNRASPVTGTCSRPTCCARRESRPRPRRSSTPRSRSHPASAGRRGRRGPHPAPDRREEI